MKINNICKDMFLIIIITHINTGGCFPWKKCKKYGAIRCILKCTGACSSGVLKQRNYDAQRPKSCLLIKRIWHAPLKNNEKLVAF